jgi:peptidylprolyl isomerase
VVQFGDADADDGQAKPLGSAARKLPAEFGASAGLRSACCRTAAGPRRPVSSTASRSAGPAGRQGLAGALLRHARRRPQQRGRQQHRRRTVRGDRQSPRQLDRNITLVGRVLKGMELLSATPRGPAPMGFYTDPTLRTPIVSIRHSDVPAAARRSGTAYRFETFADTVEARPQPRG